MPARVVANALGAVIAAREVATLIPPALSLIFTVLMLLGL